MKRHLGITFTGITFIFIGIWSQVTFAATRGQFFIGNKNAMVTISFQAQDGTTDDDAAAIYKLLNVPVQDTFLGQGKAIASGNKDFSMSCGSPPGRGPMCSLVLNQSARVILSPTTQKMGVRITGDEAKVLFEQWNSVAGKLEFITTDRKMKILNTIEEFSVQFSEEGL